MGKAATCNAQKQVLSWDDSLLSLRNMINMYLWILILQWCILSSDVLWDLPG